MHNRCASKFYTWTKRVNTFDEKKFVRHHYKYYCAACLDKECSFCKKKHNVGEEKSYPVCCSGGHWLIVTSKCAPKAFRGATLRTKWYCKKHTPIEETTKKRRRETNHKKNNPPPNKTKKTVKKS